MASNSNSKGCTNKCAFDTYIKEKYFPALGIHHLTLLRGAFTDEDIRKEFIGALDLSGGNISITSWEDMENFIDSVHTKLANHTAFTKDEEAVMSKYASALTTFLNDTRIRDVIKERVSIMAGDKRSIATKVQAYETFKKAIPAQYRREVLMQFVSGVINGLDSLESQPQFSNFTRQEILNYTIPPKNGNPSKPVIEAIFNNIYKGLKRSYGTLQQANTLTEDQKIIFEALLSNPDAWKAVIDMAKDILLEAEHIKLDTNFSYAFDTEDDDIETPDPQDESPQSAEEVGPEHWQLKSDTISSFNSMSREVRSLLYKLNDKGTGVLGFPNIVDVMLIHQNLMSLRADKYCTNSDEFIQVLKDAGATWSVKDAKSTWPIQLADILEKDPYKRSIVFNTYRKNHLYYVSHNKRTEFLQTVGKVTKYYRQKSGLSGNVLLNSYAAGYKDIAFDNKFCIFNTNGSINSEKMKAFTHYLLGNPAFWSESDKLFNAELFGIGDKDPDTLTDKEKAENKRNFIHYVNLALNLHLSHEDIDALMSRPMEFKTFCTNLHKIAERMKSTSSSIRNLESLLDNRTRSGWFKRLLKSSKNTITISERVSPIEPTFRYNKGSYVAHTIPNAIGDTLERIGKYASQGREALRKYLEDTYLQCPIYATKLNDLSIDTAMNDFDSIGTRVGPRNQSEYHYKYIVHNEWLNRLYNATDEELKNPASWVNQFINNLTRGLGTNDREFQNFVEKDNYIFTLNEYMQTMADSNGTLGVVPMFITGDSNATRYITTPAMSSPEIYAKMVDTAMQEIERMNMFQGILDWCIDNDYYVSNGHAGSKKGDAFYESNPLVKNANRFTLFDFLNDVNLDWGTNTKTGHKYASWREAYDEEGKTDPTRTQFRATLKRLIEQGIDAKYQVFKDDLVEKGIVTESADHTGAPYINKETIYVEDSGADQPGFLKNFYLNTKFNLMQQLQMMTVDPGFYNSTEDMQKRYKEMIASGETLDKTAIDPSTGKPVDNNHGHQKVWYFNEITRDSSVQDPMYMQALEQAGFDKKTIDKYTKNTLTDGQGYRSFTSYRKIMIMRGLWTKEAEQVYQIIKANRDAGKTRLSIEQLKQINRLGVVFQPLKPFYFGFERLKTANGIALVPVQHKYSEFPIIPELLPAGNKLGELGRAMEAKGIDLTCCTTTVKVGGFGSFDLDGCNTSDEIIASASKGYVHELDLDGWRQQSNVPEHTDTSRARGTQWAKHGYGCLADSAPKAYGFLKQFKDGIIRLTSKTTINLIGGNKIDQLGMIKLYGTLGSAGFIQSSIALTNQLSSPESCSETLSQMRANDSRGSNDDISAYELNDEGEFNLSPCEGITAADNMASLLSKLRKEVIKQRMKGGSCVQVSAYGMDDILKVHTSNVTTAEGDKINIVYADCARTFDYSVTTADGKQVKLDYFDFVDPETGKLLDENGNAVEPEDADAEHEHYGWNTKIGKMYPGILDMIAYRIPTEKDYSILNLKARRFFPKTTGGIMMVPSQFTTIAGFDFDIDKLYFVQREYRYSKANAIYDNYDIWSDFYNETELGKKMLPYLIQAYNADTKVAPGYETKGNKVYKDYNDYWDQARRLMLDAGIDISDIPNSNSEAFNTFVHTHADRYGNLKYVTLESRFDPEKPILDQPQEAINNLLFDFYQARLEDYDTFKERYTPGGPIMLKKAKPVMLAITYAKPEELAQCETLSELMELSKKFDGYSYPYDPTELSTIAHYQTYNALYDKLIGVAANQNINQRLTSLLESIALKDPIKFASLVECVDPAAGKDIKQRVINGVDTELLNTEFLSSAVDAVKDALLEYFGIDDNNFNAACLLSKLGASPTDIGLLLNQPIIKKAMALIKESNFSKNISSALDEALQDDEFSGKNYEHDLAFFKELEDHDVRDKYLDSDSLVRYLALDASVDYKGRKQEYLKGQYAVAHIMKEIVACSSELSDQVSVSKSTSTNSVQSTLGGVENTEMKVINFISKFGGNDSKFNVTVFSGTNDATGEFINSILDPFLRFHDKGTAEAVLDKCCVSPYCMEQVAFSAIMNFVDEVVGAIFPYRTSGFKSLQNSLAGLTQRGQLSADLCDLVHKDAMLFLIERMTNVFNEDATVKVLSPTGQEYDSSFTQRVFYKEVFPTYFEKVMANNKNAVANGATVDYSQIPLLAAVSKEAEGYSKGKKNSTNKEFNQVLKFAGIGGLKGYQKDILKESWEQMYASGDPILMDMAKHLFMYSYYSRGFQFGDTSFMSLAPVQLKKDIFGGEYALFFNRAFNLSADSSGESLTENGLGDGLSSGMSIKDFLKAFILNHSVEYQFTKNLDKHQLSKLKNITPGGLSDMNTEVDTSVFIEKTPQFTIDFNNEKVLNSSLKSLGTAIKDNKGNVIGYKFTPCIRIGDALYVCDTNINGNDPNFNISTTKSITYYRMDLPFGLDYSKPQLYGTREAKLKELAKDNMGLIEAIKQFNIAYLLDMPLTLHEPGDDNTHGGEIQSSDIGESLNKVPLAIQNLVALFAANGDGCQFWHVKLDFIDSLNNALDGIRYSLDSISDSDNLDEQLEIINSILESNAVANPMISYINDLEEAISLGTVIFDFETTHPLDADARDKERCGIALIGAIAIKDGLIVPGTQINTFVLPQEGHNTDATFVVNKYTGESRENPVHIPYQKALADGTAIKEIDALNMMRKSIVRFQRTFGYNSVYFDSRVLTRRLAALNISDHRLATIRHFDAMSVARLALDGRGLPNYKRETVTQWLRDNKPEFAEEIDSLRLLLGATSSQSHDAMNDVIETYCIIKHLMPELRETNVVHNSAEYKAFVRSLQGIKSTIEYQLKLKLQQENLNPSLNKQADEAPAQVDNDGTSVCG